MNISLGPIIIEAKEMTLQSRFEHYFKELGFAKIESRTLRYKVYKKDDFYVFLGRNGSVRVSNRENINTTFSQTRNYKQRLEEWETYHKQSRLD